MSKRKEETQESEQNKTPKINSDKILVQFESSSGETLGQSLNLPTELGPQQLNLLVNQLLNNEESLPYSFQVEDSEIVKSIHEDIIIPKNKSCEQSITIIYQPQAIFKVRAVTRCSSTLNGHTEAILTIKFSPDGKYLASGSGDTTVRLWDLSSDTPKACLNGHSNWVLMLEWYANGEYLASGGMDNTVRVWPMKGETFNQSYLLKGHNKWITSLAWEPFHLNNGRPRLASSSKDGTIRVWDVLKKVTEFTLSGHSSCVTSIKWGAGGLNSIYKKGVIYSASQDRTIKLWCGETGKLITTLNGHAHWVNSLALSTDFVLKTGPFDHTCTKLENIEDAKETALKRYEKNVKEQGDTYEKLVSGSDDFTMIFWKPFTQDKPVHRMTGHQKLVNQVMFSPDGRYVGSASFDKSIKLWDGKNGNFIRNLRGHVQNVYQLCFSSDSRMVISASKDSTCKIFDVRTAAIKVNLPGHLDEVFAIDWSPKADKVASGGKDKTLKIWRH